jgi:hypothetical protein
VLIVFVLLLPPLQSKEDKNFPNFFLTKTHIHEYHVYQKGIHLSLHIQQYQYQSVNYPMQRQQNFANEKMKGRFFYLWKVLSETLINADLFQSYHDIHRYQKDIDLHDTALPDFPMIEML